MADFTIIDVHNLAPAMGVVSTDLLAVGQSDTNLHKLSLGELSNYLGTSGGLLEFNDLDGFLYDVQYNSTNHRLTFYQQNAPNIVIDLPIEQLIKGVQLVGDDLVFTFEDDSTVTVPLNTLLVGVVKSVNGLTPNSQGEIILNVTDIPNLSSELDNKLDIRMAGLVSNLTQPEKDAILTKLGVVNNIVQVLGLSGNTITLSNGGGSISLNISNIVGLQGALDLKADISQIPTNYITTNTNQTGLTGNKSVDGTWTFNSQINTANHGNSSEWKQAYDWVSLGGVSRTTVLLNSSNDLDLVIEPGYYHHNAVSAPLNAPITGSALAGYLEVVNNGTSGSIRQAWRARDVRREYQRTRSSNGNWSAWVEYITTENLDSQATSLGFIKSSALPTVNDGQLTLSTGTGLTGSATFTANQSGSSTFTVGIASTHVLPTTVEVSNWDDAVALSHSHANKALLDTYNQTNADITDAVDLRHTHTNKAILDAITAAFTVAEKDKLADIEPNAQVNVNADWNATSGDAEILNKPVIPAQLVYTGSNGINVTGTVISPIYGTTANTIAEGNDARINNGQTAYDWGHFRDYGLDTPVDMSIGQNLSTLDFTGFAKTLSGTDFPIGVAGNGFVINNYIDNDRGHQIVGRVDSDNVFYRRNFNGWSAWVQFWHDGNFNPAQYVLQSALNTQLANYVPINGITTINNTKTFTSSPIVPNATLNGHTVNLGQLNTILGDYALASDIPTNNNQLTNGAGYITASALNGYATQLWVGQQGYLTTETDPIFTASPAYGISSVDITNWNSKTSNTGTVTSIIAGTGLSGGTITTSGTIALNSATLASLALADTALQSGDDISELNNDAGYITSSSLPTNYITTNTNQTGLTGNKTTSGIITSTGGFVGSLTGNATTASTLDTARTINGTSFNGSANIVTSLWGTARNITIGNTTKSVNGSGNVSWSLAEIGITNQNLSLGTSAGQINISGGTGVNLTSIAKYTKQNANVDILTDGGVHAFINTTSSTNYPSELGGGFGFRRGTTFQGAFDIWASNINDNKIYYRRGATATTYNTYDIFASERWVTQQINNISIPTVNDGQLSIATGTGLSGSVNFTANQAGDSSVTIDVASTHKLPTTTEWNALPTTNTITRLRGTATGTYTSGDLTLLEGAGIGITQSGSNFTITNLEPNIVQTLSQSGQTITLSNGGGSVTIPFTDWADIPNKPLVFPPSSHTHLISEVTGLQNALDDKADTDGGNATGALATTIANSHTHANKAVLDGITAGDITNWDNKFTLPSGGNAGQYVNGLGNLATLPTIPTVNNGTFQVQGTGSLTGSGSTSANASANTSATLDLTTAEKDRIQQGVDAYALMPGLIDGVDYHHLNVGGNVPIEKKKTIINIPDGSLGYTINVDDAIYDGYELAINGCGEWSVIVNGSIMDKCGNTDSITLGGLLGASTLFWWSKDMGMWIQAI